MLHLCSMVIPWFRHRKPVYLEFCKYWSSPEFKVKSEKKRLNHGNKHKYGIDEHICRSQCMVRFCGSSDIYIWMLSCDLLLTTGQAGWRCEEWHWGLHRAPSRIRSFKLGSTLLIIGHRCFGELSPFLDVLHRCSLSNLHFCCFS
jgi:hypothetical protein